MNVGIIGPGRVAHRFAAACENLDNIHLWSVASRDRERAKVFAEQYKTLVPCPAYDDIHAFLADPQLDAVVIAVPDELHAQYAILAAEQGKHMLIEKPLCTNVQDGKRILEAVKSTGVKCAIGYHLRWHAGLRKLAQHLHTNGAKDIQHMQIHWAHQFIDEAKWRKAPENSKWWSLTVLGSHSLDIVRWYLLPSCGEVIEANITTTNNQFQGNDESSLISLKFESGATASIYSSILYSSPLKLDIYTSDTHIKGRNLTGSMDERCITIGESALDFQCEQNLYEKELLDLHKAIVLDGSPEVTLYEGLRNIQCMLGFESDLREAYDK